MERHPITQNITLSPKQAEWLRAAIKKAGKTHQQVADEVGIARTNLTNIIHGRRSVTLELLRQIAESAGARVTARLTLGIHW